MRISIHGVATRVRKHEMVIAKTTKTMKERVIHRLTALGPCRLVLMSRTRSPLCSMRLRLSSR